MADPSGGALEMRVPYRSNYFPFHAFLAKIYCQILDLGPLEILDPVTCARKDRQFFSQLTNSLSPFKLLVRFILEHVVDFLSRSFLYIRVPR